MSKKKESIVDNDDSIEKFWNKKCLKMCGSINYNNISHTDNASIHNACMMLINAFSSNSSIDEYYFIVHTDTDILHIHYAITLSKQVRLSTMCNYLTNFLGVNEFAIGLKPMTSLNSMLRYFLHSDNASVKEGKALYDITEIYSNMTYDIIQSYMDSDDEGLSFMRLLEIIDSCRPCVHVEIMNKLGLKLYHKYRYEIQRILDDLPYVRQVLDNAKNPNNDTL